jgi:hypothetical protein
MQKRRMNNIIDNQTLHLLPVGDCVVTKRTKHGFYVDMPGQKNIFIHYSETLNESIFDLSDDDE